MEEEKKQGTPPAEVETEPKQQPEPSKPSGETPKASPDLKIDGKQLSLNEIMMAFANQQQHQGGLPADQSHHLSTTISTILNNQSAAHDPDSFTELPTDILENISQDVLTNLSGFFTDPVQMQEAIKFESLQNARERARRSESNVSSTQYLNESTPEQRSEQASEQATEQQLETQLIESPPAVLQEQSSNNEGSLTNSIILSSENGQCYNSERIYVVSTERVINQSQFSEELKCRICHGVLLNPMECNKCENCFCMNCLQKWLKESGTCPFKCEGNLDFKLKPHKVIRNMLSQLKLRCRNARNGCEEEIPYEKMEIHEEVECQFEFYPCPNKEKGCETKLKDAEIEDHVRDKCLFSSVECMYCHKDFIRKNIRGHLMECDQAVRTCPHCRVQFPKSAFQIHVSTQCEEAYINCGRCQGSFKRKFTNYHDCVRHLLNQQKTLAEQICILKREAAEREERMALMEKKMSSELAALRALVENK